eukprot:scaffold104168_cov48-Attheya_sp.AAC.1
MVEITKFSVRGHRYQVARTLLEEHPDKMFARSAESEIFMERNGIRFQYVGLSPGRQDSKLYATSSTISKEIAELALEIAEIVLECGSKSLAFKCVKEFYKSSMTQAGT